MDLTTILLLAASAVVAAWGLALVLNVNGMAELYGRRGLELRQRGYVPAQSNVPFSRMITPSTTAGARRLGAGILILGVGAILGILAG